MTYPKINNQINPYLTTPMNEVIALPTSAGFSILQVCDITFVASDGNYSKVFYQGNKMAHVNRKLSELEKFLPSNFFIRPHHQYLVNKLYTAGYNKKDGEIYLKSGKKIPVSVRKRKEFIAFFNTID